MITALWAICTVANALVALLYARTLREERRERIAARALPRPKSLRTAPAPRADRPVSKEFIDELERCGARPEFVAFLRAEREKP